MSLLTDSEGAALYSLLEKYGVIHTLVTSSQQLMVTGIAEDTLVLLKKEISTIFPIRPGYGVSSVHACPAVGKCRYAVGDTLQIGRNINDLRFDTAFPHKVKVGIAGCNMCCTQPYLRDIGLLARRTGWTVLFGGNGGGRPRIADILAEGLTEEEAVILVNEALQVYLQLGSPKQRTARFIEQVGTTFFKETVGL